MVFPRAGNVRVWRTKQQKFRRGYVVPKVQGGGGSVMVWGCIWAGGHKYIRLLKRNFMP
ncbi:hypothetical protein CLU79DRAFT_738304 [Phycomyces nitens]|nr:hypothetical protein CLU79DRAFT_738304 [Phycomyces nitens]